MGRYLPQIPQPYKRSDAEKFIARRVLSPWETNPSLAIVMDSTVIGHVRLKINVASERAELGSDIAAAYWGKGLATEASDAVLGLGFGDFKLQKVFAGADLRNRRSWRVVERLGMTREGLSRGSSRGRCGERTDTVYYGMLRKEWEAAHV